MKILTVNAQAEYKITHNYEAIKMDENFLDEYLIELNSELKNKRFVSEFKKELEELNKDKLKKLIEKHF